MNPTPQVNEQEPKVQRIIPVETLIQKIGTLIVQNDFLAEEVSRVSKLYLGLKGELAAEIGVINQTVNEAESLSDDVKSYARGILHRIKAKLE